MKKDIQNSGHYIWGVGCHAWHLAKTQGLSVIQEMMSPNTEEKTHYHQSSQQFFYILKGIATFVVNEETTFVNEGEGLLIIPNTIHQIKNSSSQSLDFLVISQPTSKGDRLEEPYSINP